MVLLSLLLLHSLPFFWVVVPDFFGYFSFLNFEQMHRNANAICSPKMEQKNRRKQINSIKIREEEETGRGGEGDAEGLEPGFLFLRKSFSN